MCRGKRERQGHVEVEKEMKWRVFVVEGSKRDDMEEVESLVSSLNGPGL